MNLSAQSRRLFLNLLLLVVIAVLGWLVWWQAGQPGDAPETLLDLPQAGIHSITITRQPDSTMPDIIQLKKQADGWRMVEPEQAAIDAKRLKLLFTLLNETVEADYDASDKNLAQYGLEPGEVSVAFNDQILLFGGVNPVSKRRYILHEGRIKLISEAVYGVLTGDSRALLAEEKSGDTPVD